MKKVKIMLLSLAVLAIIGGALAFEASKFNATYCTIQAQFTDNGPFPATYYCPNDAAWEGSKVCAELINVRTEPRLNVLFQTNVCTTQKQPAIPCNLHVCTTLATVYADN